MERRILLTLPILPTVLLTIVSFLNDSGELSHSHPLPWLVGTHSTYLYLTPARRIYLDNTYCDPRFCQPPRADVAKAILRRLKKKWPCIVFISSHAVSGSGWSGPGKPWKTFPEVVQNTSYLYLIGIFRCSYRTRHGVTSKGICFTRHDHWIGFNDLFTENPYIWWGNTTDFRQMFP